MYESGNVHFEMNIDFVVYPIDHITNFAEHLDYKSQEKRVEKTIQNTKRTLPEKPIKEENEIYSHRKHDDAVKEHLFFFKKKKKMKRP